MPKKICDYSLLEELPGFFHLPWFWLTVIIAGTLFLLLILSALTMGYFTDGVDLSFWRSALQPTVIVYILAIFPLIQRLWKNALQSLRVLLPRPEIFNRISTYDRRWEWTSLVIGAVFAVLMSQPWDWVEQMTNIYTFGTTIIMFSLLGLLIYNGLSGTLRLAQLNRQLNLDIFNTQLLVPVGRWSLGVSLAFVGGISLSVIFQPFEKLKTVDNAIVYAVLVGVTILLFFMSMWSTHNAIVSAKKRELETVLKNLNDARRSLKEHMAQGSKDNIDRLYSAVTVWGLYEKQVQEVSTWPFNAGIVGRLVASAIVPAIIYLLKIFTGLRFG